MTDFDTVIEILVEKYGYDTSGVIVSKWQHQIILMLETMTPEKVSDMVCTQFEKTEDE